MKSFIKKLDKKLFNLFTLIFYSILDLKLYVIFRINNLTKSKKSNFSISKFSSNIQALNLNGVTKIENFYDKKFLKKLETNFNFMIKDFKNLSPAKLGDKNLGKFLNRDQFEKGEKFFSKIATQIQIIDPFVTYPELLKIALDDNLVNLAKSYFETDDIYITGVNFRRSYANDLNANDTQMYHRDRHTYKGLKIFIYLNNVDEDTGPFQYITNSHKNWPFLSNRKYRWEDNYIETYYGKKSLFSATGSVGDIILADTTGFHKGKRLNKNNRTMLTLNYSTHRDIGNQSLKLKKFNEYSFDITPDKKSLLGLSTFT